MLKWQQRAPRAGRNAVPTNLPPEYFQADRRLREAQTPADKIACLEELISTVPKHKGTDKLRADLRRQLSRLKDDANTRKKREGHQTAYQIEKEGAGQAVLVGPANTGKSALVAALTRASPEVSPVPYTTREPLPGMMPVQNVHVQLVDTPAMEAGLAEPALFELARHADLLLVVVDLQSDPLEQIHSTVRQLAQHRILPAGWKGPVEGERMVALPLLILANKCDDPAYDEDFSILCDLFEGECPLLPVSAATGRNFDALKQAVFTHLDVIRVYARPPGRPPDMERPFVLKRGSTVADLARKVHRDFYDNLKSARVWGSSAFPGQPVPKEYVLRDEDVVELKL
jgi:uncharacterized protein